MNWIENRGSAAGGVSPFGLAKTGDLKHVTRLTNGVRTWLRRRHKRDSPND